MSYLKLTPLNTEWNRKHKLANGEGTIFLINQSNGFTRFAHFLSKGEKRFFICQDEIFTKNFQTTQEEFYSVIEDLKDLKFSQYP